MKFKLNPRFSDVFILIYVVMTLFIRFKLESQVVLNPLLSLFIGFLFVIIIWGLIKIKFLNPNWFGLIKSKSREE